MPDYSNGKIYTIRCKIDKNVIYVGATTSDISKRFNEHISTSKNNRRSLLYKTVDGNWSDWYIELYEEFPCNKIEELSKRESEIIREIGTLNCVIPGRSRKEWVDTNSEKIKEYKQKYYRLNRNKI